MAGIPWSGQEKEMLREMALAGKTVPQIRRVLKSRSKSSIQNMAYDLGVSLAGSAPEIDFEAFHNMMKTVRNPQCV